MVDLVQLVDHVLLPDVEHQQDQKLFPVVIEQTAQRPLQGGLHVPKHLLEQSLVELNGQLTGLYLLHTRLRRLSLFQLVQIHYELQLPLVGVIVSIRFVREVQVVVVGVFYELFGRLSQVDVDLQIPQIRSGQRGLRKHRSQVKQQRFLLFLVLKRLRSALEAHEHRLLVCLAYARVLLHRTLDHPPPPLDQRLQLRRIRVRLRRQYQLKPANSILGRDGALHQNVSVLVLDARHRLLKLGVRVLRLNRLNGLSPLFCVLFCVLGLRLHLLRFVLLEDPVLLKQDLQMRLIDVLVNLLIAIGDVGVRVAAHHDLDIRDERHLDASVLAPRQGLLRQLFKHRHVSHVVRVQTQLDVVLQRNAPDRLLKTRFQYRHLSHLVLERLHSQLFLLLVDGIQVDLHKDLLDVVAYDADFRL